MTTKIAEEIQQQQNHGRAKYGSGPDDLAHDDAHTPQDWARFIIHHNAKAFYIGPVEERRAALVKVAGLAVSAVEAIDRKAEAQKA